MKRSEQRILTTHTGSLPRPERLVELVYGRERGENVATEDYERVVEEAVQTTVGRQAELGIDVVSDGEMSKLGFNVYAKDRLSGFGGRWQRRTPADLLDHPDLFERLGGAAGRQSQWPACDAPITYIGADEVRRDIRNFDQAIPQTNVEEAFLTAAAPGAIAVVLGEGYYPTYEAYVHAIADAMRTEYRAIVEAGFVLQLDAPDLAMERNLKFTDASLDDFLHVVAVHVEAINSALQGLPREQVRLHVCWGNYVGTHERDVPLRELIGILLTARVGALSIESSNPRHEHEWRLFESVKLPDGMVLIPGVIDTCTNYVEHPELVAERIIRIATLVGRENVIAGTDCGFATFARGGAVAPSVAWRKLRCLVEGAAIASKTLW